MITLTAYRWVPPFAQGLVRDLRARWALEEAGIPYTVRLIDHAQRNTPQHRALQPFGQVPTLEEDGLVLFESGAIALYIAERSELLMPADRAGRARATAWVFAALNSIETFVQQLVMLHTFHAQDDWAKLRRPSLEAQTGARLDDLAARLDGREYLEDRFTIGDLMMTTVLRIARDTDLASSRPALAAYVARCEARPAFKRALAAQMADFQAP